jgi:hypothetical protein
VGKNIFGVHAGKTPRGARAVWLCGELDVLLCGELDTCSIVEVVVVVIDLELKEAVFVEKVGQNLLLVGSRT